MRPVLSSIAIATLSLFVVGMSSASWTVTLHQVDYFQDGSTEGWRAGEANPNPPSWVSDGGPLGAGDGFLRIEANGAQGSGGNLVAFNTKQWAGDYLGAGVRVLQLDVRNLGGTDLTVRLLFEGPGGDFYTTEAASLSPGGPWRTVRFAVEPRALTGGSNAEETLADVGKLRIIHAPTTAARESIEGVLGVDNITALSGEPCRDANLGRQQTALCTAYCESLDCDGVYPRAAPTACMRLQALFEEAAGTELPCARADSDMDGVTDELDNCPAISNSNQSDLDEDAVGDVCDNCPDDFNPGQEDLAGALGIGDACDCPCFTLDDALIIATESTCDAICVIARPTSLNLTALQCSAARPDWAVLVEEFTDFGGEPLCQLNSPVPGESVIIVGLSDSQVVACQSYVLEAAGANGIECQ